MSDIIGEVKCRLSPILCVLTHGLALVIAAQLVCVRNSSQLINFFMYAVSKNTRNSISTLIESYLLVLTKFRPVDTD